MVKHYQTDPWKLHYIMVERKGWRAMWLKEDSSLTHLIRHKGFWFLLSLSFSLRLGKYLPKQKKSCSSILYLDPCLITRASPLHSAATVSAQSQTRMHVLFRFLLHQIVVVSLSRGRVGGVGVWLFCKMNKSQWISSPHYLCEIVIKEMRFFHFLHRNPRLS